ncbi:MAG: nucleotidyltransferase family protein [Eubacteriales bacterium]|nr:nucleotidyltransferase family protein [Eubacteriales bacterium]
MKIVGIICEYNPFHLGHARMLRTLREQGADAIVCAMSGNFAQRGDFAIVNKHSRAEMALHGGADLVLELPTPWAMATAETFARGGVQLLTMAGCTHLAFGCECGHVTALQKVTDLLLEDGFADKIKNHLSEGVSFAVARKRAAEEQLGTVAELLDEPNNILAIEYLKAIRLESSSMQPIALPRIGAAHDGNEKDGIASASQVRQWLREGDIEQAAAYMPDYATDILRWEIHAGRMTDMALCERSILAHLRRMKEEDFIPYDGGNEGLYHRFYQAVQASSTLEEVLQTAKTKRYAYARLRRMALAAYLDIPPVPNRLPYLRLLGANEIGRKLLRGMQKAELPILTKPADAGKLGAEAAGLFREECRMTDLYNLGYADLQQSVCGSDWRAVPVME